MLKGTLFKMTNLKHCQTEFVISLLKNSLENCTSPPTNARCHNESNITLMNLPRIISFCLITCLLLISFQEAIGQHDYAKAQHLSTYFLGAQRSGDTKSWIHGPSHTKDGEAVGKDLSGGWYDCGDYIKFHHTEPYAALALLYGYDKFPEAYADNYSQDFSAPPANGIPDILDEVKIQTDYLIKCIDGGTVYWHVGGAEDHNSFSEPVTNSNENLYNGSSVRPVNSTTSGHSNAMGNSASALALMGLLYAPFDQNYANQCITAAEGYYAVGSINPQATADADNFYSWLSGSSYKDEMGLAAAILYRATNQQSYLTAAENYAGDVSKWGTFNYGDVSHLLLFELYKITNTTSYLNDIGDKVATYSVNSCGYMHISQWGSLRDASNAAFLAALYHMETGNSDAYTFTKRNMDFILGTHGHISDDAPADFSFLIGYNELEGGFPQHPHHAAAFGKSTNVWGQYTQESNNPGSVSFEHELTGGLAGGPEAACANFEDNINNYISSEYCVYYNAAFTGAVAYVNKIENNIVMNTSAKNSETSYFWVSQTNLQQATLHGKPGTYQITSALGNQLSQFQKGSEAMLIDLQSLAPGAYILSDESQNRQTIVVQ